MKLLVDIGNSRLKWAAYADGELAPMQACAHASLSLGEVLDAHWAGLAAPQALWVSNVAGASAARHLQEWSEARWGLQPLFCQSTAQAAGVWNAYAEPRQLGIDRWLALIGAARLRRECLVVDCGTAVTLDRLDAQGRHLGGLIVPGIAAMRGSLRHNASALRTVTVDDGVEEGGFLLGKNTRDGVKFGTVYAVTALIEKLMDNAGTPVQCVLTGGGAAEIRPLLACRHTFIADLVLRGIAILVDTQACA